MYAKGAVLPFTHEDENNINKHIKMTDPSIVRIAHDLEQYINVGLLGMLLFLLFSCLYPLIDDLFSTKRIGL
jgi:hypothetical protein